MNKLLQLIFIDFKQLAKSKSFYLRLLLFPTVLILILGTVFKSEESRLPSFDVAFYSEDDRLSNDDNSFLLGTILEDNVLNSTDIKSMITIKDVSSYAEGKKLADAGKVSVFIYVPKGFTKAFLEDAKASITIIGNKDNPINKSIATSILDRFIQNAKATFIEEKAVVALLASNNALTKGDINGIIKHLETANAYSTIVAKISTNNNAVPIDAMQYYSIAMIVMFSISTALTLVHSIVAERLNNTLFRIKTTQTLNLQYTLGKLLGIIFAVVTQMTLFMIITRLVFKMTWGNPLHILLITAVYAFAIGALILLWGLTAKDQTSVSSMSAPILYGLSFLGGSFISRDGLPENLKLVQKIIPNGKAINAYLSVCQGGGIKEIYMDLVQLILIGSVFLIIALILYNGRKWTNHVNSNNDNKTAKATV